MVRIETPVCISGRDRLVRDAAGRILFGLNGVEAQTQLEELVLARRIVAAVNAVEHLSTVVLEQIVRRGKTLQLALAWSAAEKVDEATYEEEAAVAGA